MISGLIFAHYIFMFAKLWAPYIDRVVCRIDRKKYNWYSASVQKRYLSQVEESFDERLIEDGSKEW